jgi:hypothetical protein
MLTLMGNNLTNSNILAHCKLVRTQRIQPNLIEIYDNGFRQTQDCSQGQSVPKTASRKKPQSGKKWFKLATTKKSIKFALIVQKILLKYLSG